MNLDDTIVAIATPPGRGGIGVVRIAGSDSRSIASGMLRLAHEMEAGRAHFGELIEPVTRERIDEVVVTFFAKPHSYTTDDVVEISAHGSPVVLRHVIEMATAAGARLAEPGEFTMRAFLNGRIDLTQAEAVRDLIESQTLYQAKVAAQQLQGALSKRLQPVKKKLVDLIAVMEAGIDFAEDDVSVLPPDEIRQRINAIQEPLEQLRASFAYGKIVHEGLTLAIVGRPNVGKSSLFNRLVERERAIVTATPGTTRDLVTETVAMGGIPVKLIDTAGIRQALDEAESIGIRKSYEALSEADLVLMVMDCTQEFSEQDHELLGACQNRRSLAVANKADLDGARMVKIDGLKVFRTSALTGQGVDELRQEILHTIAGRSGGEQESGFLTNVRHQRLVEESITGLDAARQAVERKIPHEMIMLDLYGALRPLDAITGETTTDDILNLIFSSFCIGK
ncbi:MAG TPA: tRNA uridine-5-carboxymethylaminomethyl(34) synthesis GTPase MnmE [Candidatus Angelobacter sp.]|nr:tRNA uridine-5-carboxymethylaminomethyl(34) synthesis GTPase MnmE [Candidatus Angelobacter sp.]